MFEHKLIKLIESTDGILTEENTIGIDISEAGLSANQQMIVDEWKLLKLKKNTAIKTAVFETIPLIYALSPTKTVSHEYITKKLGQFYDWDWQGKQWLLNILGKIQGDDAAYQTFLDVVVGSIIKPDAPSIKDINKGIPVSGFIHGGVDTFKDIIKTKSNHIDASKPFTADVILIWGTAKASEIKKNANGILDRLTYDDDSLITLADGKTVIACVSLKALWGRVGKAKSTFMTKYPHRFPGSKQTTESIVVEGLADSVKNFFRTTVGLPSAIVTKIKEGFNAFKEWVTNTKITITSIFSNTNPKVSQYEQKHQKSMQVVKDILADLDELVGEAVSSPAVLISTCLKYKILNWYKTIQSDISLYNKAFDDFSVKIAKYKTSKLLRINFTSLDSQKKEYQVEVAKISKLISDLQRAQSSGVPIKKASTFSSKFSKTSKCFGLQLDGSDFTLRKDQLKPILMHDANYQSIGLISDMVDEYIKNTNQSETNETIANLVKFTTELDVEAIFGGAIDLPLIKYDGTKIVRYGTRKLYQQKQIDKILTYFKSVDSLPVVGVKISPSVGRGMKFGAFYDIFVYMLSDYELSDDGQVKNSNFIYTLYNFRCNRGSDFAFTIEGDTILNGDDVLKQIGQTTA